MPRNRLMRWLPPALLRATLVCVIGSAGPIMRAKAAVDVSKLPASASGSVDFSRDIRPIFEKSCHSCHGPQKQKGEFRLDLKSAALKGGETYSPAIRPGDSAGS